MIECWNVSSYCLSCWHTVKNGRICNNPNLSLWRDTYSRQLKRLVEWFIDWHLTPFPIYMEKSVSTQICLSLADDSKAWLIHWLGLTPFSTVFQLKKMGESVTAQTCFSAWLKGLIEWLIHWLEFNTNFNSIPVKEHGRIFNSSNLFLCMITRIN